MFIRGNLGSVGGLGGVVGGTVRAGCCRSWRFLRGERVAVIVIVVGIVNKILIISVSVRQNQTVLGADGVEMERASVVI